MKEYPVRLYPAKLQLVNGDSSNARMTIPLPPLLPWWKLWISVGASLYALSQGYNAAKEFLGPLKEANHPRYPWEGVLCEEGEWHYGNFTRDKSGRIYFRPVPPIVIGGAPPEDESQSDDLRIVRLHYGSPIDIDIIVGFATAFSLVGAVATGAITTVIKLLEWREKKKELEDEDRRRDLEIEKLRLELEEKKPGIGQPAITAQLPEATDLTKPQVFLVKQLFFYGSVLAGEEEVWIDPSLY
jgi:hypothetical protein